MTLFFKQVIAYELTCSGGSLGKESESNLGDEGLIPESEDPLEREMAAHSSILAWEIPQTEEPGGLQSMGSQQLDMT